MPTIQDKYVRNSLSRNPFAFTIVGSHTQNGTISAATVLSVPATANGLLVQCTTKNIRYTLDGTTPTASIGFLLTADTDPVLIMVHSDDTVITVIEVAATGTVIYQPVRVGA